MQIIKVTAIDLRSERSVEQRSGQPAVVGEDDLERPIVDPNVPAPELVTYPLTVFVRHIREFHPRKHGRSGTRIVYANGAAQIVKETVAEVEALLYGLQN